MRASKEHVHHPHATLRCLRLELPAFKAPRHRHHHLELTWVERGEGLRQVGDHTAPFEAGDLVLLGPDLPHTWLTHPGWRGKALATVVQFDPALFERPALPELAALQPLVHRAQRGLQVRPGSACHALVTQALTHVRSGAPLDQLAGLIHLLARLNEAPAADLQPLSTASLATPASSAHSPPRRIDKVVDWLHAHLAEPLRAEDAARIAHISPAAFSRFFKRELGKTFTDYLNDARCSAAAMALRQTTQPVARIAQDCGFATASHFNVQFKRRYGVGARGYREREK